MSLGPVPDPLFSLSHGPVSTPRSSARQYRDQAVRHGLSINYVVWTILERSACTYIFITIRIYIFQVLDKSLAKVSELEAEGILRKVFFKKSINFPEKEQNLLWSGLKYLLEEEV